MKTQIQSLCTSLTAVWTVQLLVSSSFSSFHLAVVGIPAGNTVWFGGFFFEGLEEISAERESLSKQRKAAATAAEESRKTLKDEDKDYEPKLTPGCLLTLIYLLI